MWRYLLYPNANLTPLAMNAFDIFINFFVEMFRFDKLELILLVIISVPTIYAMLSGAPFVPTSMFQVERMLSAVPLKKGMILYDLGAGDGRLVYKANKDYGVKAIGYEFSPFVWMWSKFLKFFFWKSKADLRYGNFWKKDLTDADVILCYLLPGSMKKMYNELLPQLSPGTLVISHAFSIPGMEPIKTLPRLHEKKLGPVRVYKIVAKATAKVGSKQQNSPSTKKGAGRSKAKKQSK